MTSERKFTLFNKALLINLLLICENRFNAIELTPRLNEDRRSQLLKYIDVVNQGKYRSNCGIIWILASLNGSQTNYDLMSRVGKGEGKLRLQAVTHEVFTSAARIKNALALHPIASSVCGSSNNRPELTLYADRDIFIHLNEFNLSFDAKCIFDKIIYFDTIPSFSSLLGLRKYRKRDILVRLAPRPNAVKLFTFLISPYK